LDISDWFLGKWKADIVARHLALSAARLRILLNGTPAEQAKLEGRLSRTGRLIWIWSISLIISFLIIMVIYTQFFGRKQIVLNQTIYEGYRYVSYPGSYQLYTAEGYGITSNGENGLVVNKALNPDAFRILFIGDSYVDARQVSDHEKFSEIVERNWNLAHPEMPIQSLNLGLGGQNMATYLSFGRNMDTHFQPKLVFMMVSDDDFKSIANKPKQLEKVAQGLTKPLVEPETYTTIEDLTNRTRYRSFLGKLRAQTYGFLHIGDTVEGQAGPKKQVPLDPEAVSVQLEALREIWGDRLVILYRMPIPNLGEGAPATYEDEVLNEIEKHEIPVINLYQPFLSAYQERTPPHGFNNSVLGQGHCNQYGHQLIAGEIISFLEARDDLF
jgi:hypothetical protein